MFDFEIKIAQNQEEKDRAFRLRNEVFKKELSHIAGSADPQTDMETDTYDEGCDHLIVVDRTKNLVVGTYRLLLGSKVDPRLGFYSEKIFDIKNIKRLGSQIVELGRSCVHKDYREGLVINLLWQGIAQYIKENNARFLFGSVRLLTLDIKEVNEVYSLVKDLYYAPRKFLVCPRNDNTLKGLRSRKVDERDHKNIFLKLPPLIKGYLRLGLKICGPPAWNKDLGSVVFFVLLDIETMSKAYKRHFLGE